ncbi:dioxygenase [Amycolatopsis sp. DSM 110486]|uniref:dioxygenase family protein n=1 Tax=Amycolatopsis sp. DSM 110486 TaxID=2865832 RepID=UPI001C69E8DF|nr:dioxygenase [Amycolatopsis sp. DSM 110486]QYN19059.1 hydroxyquinol 1,2-dioxygenase [Amycolatopsis sp. DSM 110486]
MLDPDEKTITEAVLQTLVDTPDSRIRTVLSALVQHLHDFVLDVDLTEAEWAYAIEFLTRTGQKSDDKRQEFILLSDVLGVTMLVDTVNHRRSTGTTENSVQGPFYREVRPEFADGADISNGLPGTPLLFHATVVDTTGAPVPGAEFDVWHADSHGHYDSDVPGLDAAAMRGLFRTGPDGTVTIRSIAPAPYPIPDDGPVGELMHATGRPVMRPGHIHVRIAAPGFSTVTTMLFRDDDPYLTNDPVFGTKRSLLYRRDLREGRDRPYDLVEHTFVLDRLH